MQPISKTRLALAIGCATLGCVLIYLPFPARIFSLLAFAAAPQFLIPYREGLGRTMSRRQMLLGFLLVFLFACAVCALILRGWLSPSTPENPMSYRPLGVIALAVVWLICIAGFVRYYRRSRQSAPHLDEPG